MYEKACFLCKHKRAMFLYNNKNSSGHIYTQILFKITAYGDLIVLAENHASYFNTRSMLSYTFTKLFHTITKENQK